MVRFARQHIGHGSLLFDRSETIYTGLRAKTGAIFEEEVTGTTALGANLGWEEQTNSSEGQRSPRDRFWLG